MKVLSCVKPGEFQYVEADIPLLQEGHSLLKIKRVGVCGTDLHAFGGTQPFFNYPRTLGHELAAEFVSGDAEGFIAGETVTIIPYFSCGHCIACRSGKPNCCVGINVCGVHVDGGMAEYLLVPSSSLVHADGRSLDELALIEPLAIGAHGIWRAAVQSGEFVLVVGAGPIGMGVMEFARIAGAQVIALDINDLRLGFCKEKLQVDYTINSLKEDVTARLREITNGDMPTVVIDATGNKRAMMEAFQYMAHGARYVLVGLQKEELSFSHPEFHKREATLMSSRNATREDFERVMAAMKAGLVRPSSYITHRLIFDEVKDQFESLLDPKNGVIKAMISL